MVWSSIVKFGSCVTNLLSPKSSCWLRRSISDWRPERQIRTAGRQSLDEPPLGNPRGLQPTAVRYQQRDRSVHRDHQHRRGPLDLRQHRIPRTHEDGGGLFRLPSGGRSGLQTRRQEPLRGHHHLWRVLLHRWKRQRYHGTQ
ncbi:hypothetical protein NPIL_622481, partial [Nephila pilipes]